MIRVLRYPRLFALSCTGTLACALARDFCVSSGQDGWARVLLVATLLLLALCFALMSCRFFVDELGVGVGFLLHMRRAEWNNLHALGVLYCNGRRPYLYGMYPGASDFLSLLHRAPFCGSWGFAVPLSRKLKRAVITLCPYSLNLSPEPEAKPQGHLRPLWHQAALYLLFMLPTAVLAFLTGTLMLVHASALATYPPLIGLCLCAFALYGAGAFLLSRALIAVSTCPRINESGIRAGFGLYMDWSQIHFGYVHRRGRMSGMFLLSLPLEEMNRCHVPPIRCLSLPDTSTLLLAYLTYCPYARKDMHG